MIITLSNQKGGVGKTTLAILLANYLSGRGGNVTLIDLDRQQSLTFQRQRDAEIYNDQDFSYDIIPCNIDTPVKELSAFIDKDLKQHEFVIVDAPGNLSENGLIPFLIKSDIIICPYQYERKCLDSTGTFITVLNRVFAKTNTTGKIYFIPTMIQSSVGTQEEKKIFAKTDEILSQYGKVINPGIKLLAILKRVTTVENSREQLKAIEETFKQLPL